MATLQNYGFDIVTLIALLVVSSMFVGVAYHAYTRYSEIHTGKATWGQFGLTVAVGAIPLVVAICLLTRQQAFCNRPVIGMGVAAMPSHQDGARQGLVTFLPHRLNRQPIVARGLTGERRHAER